MRRAKFIIIIILAGVSVLCLPAYSDEAEEKKLLNADKARYRQLMRQIREIDSEYAGKLGEAVDESKHSGDASLESKGELIELRDRRDRCMTRLMLISLRHGWEMPDVNHQNNTSGRIVQSEKERLFQAADNMILDAYSRQAQQIGRGIALPIISSRSAEERQTNKKGRSSRSWLKLW